MRLLILIGALLAGCWFYVNRTYASAPAVSGGPFQRSVGRCNLPQPSEKAAMIFAGYYEGAAISTVRLKSASTQEEPTTAVDVVIAPGFDPIYLLVVGERASVLRVSGWTRRLERLVVVTDSFYPTAVTGISTDKVIFADRHDCGLDSRALYEAEVRGVPDGLGGVVKRPQPASLSYEERLKRPQYRPPDALGGAYEPASLTVGWGTVAAKEYKAHDYAPDLEDWEKYGVDFNPNGVAEVDMASLTTPVPASPYDLLPGWAGLGQLIREGKLQQKGLNTFRVLAPIKVPAGLYGSQAVTFELAPGVPRPTGDLGHSKIE